MSCRTPVAGEETTAFGRVSSRDSHLPPGPLADLDGGRGSGECLCHVQPPVFVFMDICIQMLTCRHTHSSLVFHCLSFSSVTFLGKVTSFSLEGVVG